MSSSAIYGLAWVTRALMLFSSSYVHPDEIFQSSEMAQGYILRSSTRVPWEFANISAPGRSTIVPAVASAIPAFMAGSLSDTLAGGHPEYVAMMLQRAWCLALCAACDVCILLACSALDVDAMPRLALFAASWPVIVYGAHPFSNSIEMLAVAATVAACAVFFRVSRQRRGHLQLCISLGQLATLATIGCVAAFGCAVRISFPVFVSGFGIAVLVVLICGGAERQQSSSNGTKLQSSSDIQPESLDSSSDITTGPTSCSMNCGPVLRLFTGTVAVFIGFASTLASIAVADSIAWGTLNVAFLSKMCPSTDSVSFTGMEQLCPPLPVPEDATVPISIDVNDLGVHHEVATGRIVFPAIGNLLYNMDSAKTASHGEHPRWTHALVNLPMLFGPMALVLAWKAAALAEHLLRHGSLHRARGVLLARPLQSASLISAAIALVVLSVANHQEARFLLPLAVPLSLACGGVVFGTGNNGRQGSARVAAKGSIGIVQAKGPDGDPGDEREDAIDREAGCADGALSRGCPGSAFLVLWMVINAGGVIGYGWLHQGGVLAAAAAAGRRVMEEHDATVAQAAALEEHLSRDARADGIGAVEIGATGSTSSVSLGAGLGGAAVAALLSQMAGSGIGTVLSYSTYTLPRHVVTKGWFVGDPESRQVRAGLGIDSLTSARGCEAGGGGGGGGGGGHLHGFVAAARRSVDRDNARALHGGAGHGSVSVDAFSPSVRATLIEGCRSDSDSESSVPVSVPRCGGPFCDSRLQPVGAAPDAAVTSTLAFVGGSRSKASRSREHKVLRAQAIEIVDVGGPDEAKLRVHLERSLYGGNGLGKAAVEEGMGAGMGVPAATLVIAPATLREQVEGAAKSACHSQSSGAVIRRLSQHGPHFSGEAPPRFGHALQQALRGSVGGSVLDWAGSAFAGIQGELEVAEEALQLDVWRVHCGSDK